MYMKHKARQILLFAASVTPANRLCYDGVFRYAKIAKWNVHVVEYGLAAKKRQHLAEEAIPNVRDLMKMWQPDGVIVECAGRVPVLPLADFGKMPLVLLSCHPQDAGRMYPCTYSDNETITRLAARELLSLGFSDYAFVPYPEDVVWSREREAAFFRMVKSNGKRAHMIDVGDITEGKDAIGVLVDGVARLPKPCGVFAVNDEMGSKVISACKLAGRSVPDDVAVVGVDNDESLCEQSQVSLSSVRIDYEAEGFMAAELLDRWMQRRNKCRLHAKAEHRPVDVVGFVRRASSMRSVDTRVAKALEYIRCHALEHVAPSQIAEIMGVTRRFADMLFLSVAGQTVFDELRQTRIERVKDKLSSRDRSLASIADECGYCSLQALCREFKSVTGHSMREWRKERLP